MGVTQQQVQDALAKVPTPRGVALVIILAMGIGLFAPPFGVGFYGACAIGRVSPDDALGRMWPYLGALAVALAIVVAFPWLSIGFL